MRVSGLTHHVTSRRAHASASPHARHDEPKRIWDWIVADLVDSAFVTEALITTRAAIRLPTGEVVPVLEAFQLFASVDRQNLVELERGRDYTIESHRSGRHRIRMDVLCRELHFCLPVPGELDVEILGITGMTKLLPQKYGFLDRQTGTYHGTHDCGLFSNLSVALATIAVLRCRQESVAEISFRHGMRRYKSDERSPLYPDLFAPPSPDQPVMNQRPPRLDVHLPFSQIGLDDYKALVGHYFSPSEEVRALTDRWTALYGIRPAETVGIYYRGTDKAREVTLGRPEAYAEQAERALQALGSAARVLIQTDESRVRDLFVARFGERAFFIDDIPVSADGVALHVRGLASPREEAVQLLAMVRLLAGCATVVLGCGNVSAWIALYRGHTSGLVQFDAEGAAPPSR